MPEIPKPYYSEMNGIESGQIAIVGRDGRAVCFIPYLHPDSEKIKNVILNALNESEN